MDETKTTEAVISVTFSMLPAMYLRRALVSEVLCSVTIFKKLMKLLPYERWNLGDPASMFPGRGHMVSYLAPEETLIPLKVGALLFAWQRQASNINIHQARYVPCSCRFRHAIL